VSKKKKVTETEKRRKAQRINWKQQVNLIYLKIGGGERVTQSLMI